MATSAAWPWRLLAVALAVLPAGAGGQAQQAAAADGSPLPGWQLIGNGYCQSQGVSIGRAGDWLGKNGCKDACDQTFNCNSVVYDTTNGRCYMSGQPELPDAETCVEGLHWWSFWKSPEVLCADQDEHCNVWASNGECLKNPWFMMDKCRLACGACPGQESTTPWSWLMSGTCTYRVTQVECEAIAAEIGAPSFHLTDCAGAPCAPGGCYQFQQAEDPDSLKVYFNSDHTHACSAHQRCICRHEGVPFDPSSPLVSYTDDGACGPRGDDARHDAGACRPGQRLEVETQVSDADGAVIATIGGCGYSAYTVYHCVDDPDLMPTTTAPTTTTWPTTTTVEPTTRTYTATSTTTLITTSTIRTRTRTTTTTKQTRTATATVSTMTAAYARATTTSATETQTFTSTSLVSTTTTSAGTEPSTTEARETQTTTTATATQTTTTATAAGTSTSSVSTTTVTSTVTSTTVTTTVTTTTTLLRLSGEVDIEVSDPVRFASNPAVRDACAEGIAETAHVPAFYIEVTLSAGGGRRLRAAREDSADVGDVRVIYTMELPHDLPDGHVAEAADIESSLTGTSPEQMAQVLSTKIANKVYGESYRLNVTSIHASVAGQSGPSIAFVPGMHLGILGRILNMLYPGLVGILGAVLLGLALLICLLNCLLQERPICLKSQRASLMGDGAEESVPEERTLSAAVPSEHVPLISQDSGPPEEAAGSPDQVIEPGEDTSPPADALAATSEMGADSAVSEQSKDGPSTETRHLRVDSAGVETTNGVYLPQANLHQGRPQWQQQEHGHQIQWSSELSVWLLKYSSGQDPIYRGVGDVELPIDARWEPGASGCSPNPRLSWASEVAEEPASSDLLGLGSDARPVEGPMQSASPAMIETSSADAAAIAAVEAPPAATLAAMPAAMPSVGSSRAGKAAQPSPKPAPRGGFSCCSGGTALDVTPPETRTAAKASGRGSSRSSRAQPAAQPASSARQAQQPPRGPRTDEEREQDVVQQALEASIAESVKSICDFTGVSEAQARSALQQANGDQHAAINNLLSGDVGGGGEAPVASASSGSVPPPATASSAQPTVDEAKVQQLATMTGQSEEAARAALIKHGGDPDAAALELLQ